MWTSCFKSAFPLLLGIGNGQRGISIKQWGWSSLFPLVSFSLDLVNGYLFAEVEQLSWLRLLICDTFSSWYEVENWPFCWGLFFKKGNVSSLGLWFIVVMFFLFYRGYFLLKSSLHFYNTCSNILQYEQKLTTKTGGSMHYPVGAPHNH